LRRLRSNLATMHQHPFSAPSSAQPGALLEAIEPIANIRRARRNKDGFLSESRCVVIAKPFGSGRVRLRTGYQPRAEGFSRWFLQRNSSRLRSGRGLVSCSPECGLLTPEYLGDEPPHPKRSRQRNISVLGQDCQTLQRSVSIWWLF
jgi:hypothetical protein